MRYSANPTNIHKITEAEAERILDDYRKWINDDKTWGGLFLYQAPNRKHPRKIRWIAIDDSDGHCYVREFKKKEDAIKWLLNPSGPKYIRM